MRSGGKEEVRLGQEGQREEVKPPQGEQVKMRISQGRSLVVVVVVAGIFALAAAPGWAATEVEPAPWWGITTGSRPTDLVSGVASDEVQQLTATTGAAFGFKGMWFELGVGGKPVGQFATGEIDGLLGLPQPTEENIQKALEGSEFYGPGGVVVSEEPAPAGSLKLLVRSVKKGPVPTLEVIANHATEDGGTVEARILSEGRVDGQLVVEAENLGDAEAQGEDCVKVAAGMGKFKDSACSELAEPGHEEFERTPPKPVTITDKLPAGLTAVAAEGQEGIGKEFEQGPVNCVVAPSGSEVTCTYEAGVPAFEQVEVLIPVVVEGATSGEVNTATVSGGGAGLRIATHEIEVNGSERFGIEDYSMLPESPGGSVDTQAGSHPFQLTTVLTANSAPPLSASEAAIVSEVGLPRSVGLPRDYVGELPAGLVGNPTPFEQCTDAQFASNESVATRTKRGEAIINGCPASSAVGVALVRFAGPAGVGNLAETVPIFNMVPLKGEPARFAFKAAGIVPVFLDASVRTGSDYGVTISSHEIVQTSWLLSSKLTFWGVPGAKSHDNQRGWACLRDFGSCSESTALTPPPFLIMPTSCEAPFKTTLLADSWPAEGKPSENAQAAYELEHNGQPLKLTGCNNLSFSPSIEVTPDVLNASTSTGLNVKVHVPQTAELNPEGRAESTLRNTTVTLPAGVTVNPSGANGLEACSEGLVGYLPGESHPPEELRFTPRKPGSFGTEGGEATLQPGINFCPNGSKIGEVAIKSPLLPADQPVTGFVYLADQNSNPFGSLIAMYAVAEDPVSGTLIKLPFNVSLNPDTDQLVATSDNSPELPFETA
jgi:hypothetical protein